MKKPAIIDINLQQKNTKVNKEIPVKNNVDLSNKSNKDYKNTLNINIQKVKKNK